jgi:hypothetical protein
MINLANDRAARVRDSQTTKQLVIIHLSDLHFGRTHRFNPPKAPSGDIPAREGYPTLLEKLSEDLSRLPNPNCPVVICATGDFAETGDLAEFQQALEFLKGSGSAKIIEENRGLGLTFIVAGNHDVVYDKNTPDLRLANLGGSLMPCMAPGPPTPIRRSGTSFEMSTIQRASSWPA